MEKSYTDKVFSDITNAIGESVIKHAKTREDKLKGLEILVNFNKIMNDYENVIKVLQENEKINKNNKFDIEEDKNI